MKTILLIVAALAIVSASQWEQKLLSSDPTTLKQFEAFMRTHNKLYGSYEEMYNRFEVFKTNLDTIEWINTLATSSVHGVTQFADLSPEEFKAIYLTLQMKPVTAERKTFPPTTETSWDWRDHGAMTGVKNQGSCGSCWAFSAIANIEGQYFLGGNTLTSFSEQELVDCDTVDQGCNGGLMEDAFKQLESIGGVETESDYPYKGVGGTCEYAQAKEKLTIKGYHFISTDETQIASALVSEGPMAIAVNASWFQFYLGGILDIPLCNPKNLDHGVTLAGFGTGKTILGKMKDYWLIKNSWGPGWGEKGYIKIRRGKGYCGVNTYVITAEL